MYLDFFDKGSVKVLIIKYVKKVLGLYTKEIKSTSNVPASDHLFLFREESEAKFLP